MPAEPLQPVVIDNTYYSIGFPRENFSRIISRQEYFASISDAFTSGADVVFVEGSEGTGKTTILAHYAKLNVKDTISVFFNPLNSLDFHVDFICSNIVDQIRYWLGGDMSENGGMEVISKDIFRLYTFQVRKKLRGTNRKLTLIIDGLESKFPSKEDVIDQIVEQFPFGNEHFNLVITCDESAFKDRFPQYRSIRSKVISVNGFSDGQVEEYLGASLEDKSSLKEVFKVTRGYPGRLKTLKRLLEAGNYSIDELVLSSNYKQWIELDCKEVDFEDKTLQALISVISLTDTLFSTDQLSEILSIAKEEVSAIIDRLTVLQIDKEKVSFISPEYKRYFANRLRVNDKKVDELLIAYYQKERNPLSLIELPKILSERKEWQKVINSFDEKYASDIISRTESVSEVVQNLGLARQASEQLKSFPDVYRFSLEASLLNEMDNFLFWESEVKARIAIKDFAGAISLAETAILKIDRLKMLTLIARRQKESKNSVDEELIELIYELYKSSDLGGAGEKLFDIVSDLIYALPNLAIEMIEKTSGQTADKGINDWIVAKLSIAAIDSSLKNKEDPEKSKAVEAVEKIGGGAVKKINKAISLLVGDFSGSRVLDEVKKLTDSIERLRLLRLWLTNHKGKDDCLGEVIAVALQELVTSSSKSILTVDILKELSDQLAFVHDVKLKDRIYWDMKNLQKTVTEAGLGRNKIIFSLNLFHTEFTMDKLNSIDSLNRIFQEIEQINDTLMQLEAYAEVYVKLSGIVYSPFQQRVSFSYKRILELCTSLFTSTARHYELVKHTVVAIARKNPVLALKIVNQINNQWKREKARLKILESYLNNPIKHIKFELLELIRCSFENESAYEYYYVSVADRFSEAKSLPSHVAELLVPFIGKIQKIKSPRVRTFGLVRIYSAIALNEKTKVRHGYRIEGLIKFSLGKIESEWEKIDAGYSICADVSKINEAFARSVFQESAQLKDHNWIDSSDIAEAYLIGIRLVIASMTGIIQTKDLQGNDQKIISQLFERVPSKPIKLELWTELGFAVYLAGDLAYAKQINNDHVIPIVEEMIQKGYELGPAIHALTFIHLFLPDFASEKIKLLSTFEKERVYTNICNFYITSESPYRIYDTNNKHYKADYSALINAIGALSNISTDHTLHWHIDIIAKAIVDNRNISKPQNATLTSQLDSIIASKLPDEKNIRHLGYKVVCELKVAKAKKELPDAPNFWQRIIEDAAAIPNRSDRIFVKMILLEDLPFNKLKGRSPDAAKAQVYQDILDDLDKISTNYEFIQRVTEISETMYSANRSKWKEVVRSAFTISNKLDRSSDAYKSQKALIDTIYRIDSSYAKELVKLTEEDQSGFKHGERLKRHFDHLEMVDRIKNDKSLTEKEKENNLAIVAAVIESLKGVNSEKIIPKKAPEASAYMYLGMKLPLREVYPIYLYYLANCAKTYSTKGSMIELHRNNFKRAVQATELIQSLSYRKKGSEQGFRKFFIDEAFSSNAAITPASREEALNYIKGWMQDQMTDYLIIADPYFEKTDLDFLKLVVEVNKDVSIDILASHNGPSASEEEYKDYWRKISDEIPPFTNICFCWIPEDNNNTPFHDRWLLTKDGGLRMGTSINGLGGKKEHEISVMSANEALVIQQEKLGEYIARKKKSVNGMRVQYKGFSM